MGKKGSAIIGLCVCVPFVGMCVRGCSHYGFQDLAIEEIRLELYQIVALSGCATFLKE